MNVQVKLFGTLRMSIPDYDPSKGIWVAVSEGATAGDLIASLDLPHGKSSIAVVNNRVVGADARLKENDEIYIIQRALGG
ncbi:thiamineS protein [Desulfatibacillum aliphaticivorans]|uniref:ThiamineS protein n=1 Tax=Desulfatibacillum aliphaticivorans TaxID=218208 RepID=B8F8T4_DESAL|nr:MoaD/ThiS family protein [Desulfatibacillum aliphaticivorans]ACL01966.1 thiamineS protein [Desulfatibacillum aliphaticivorans]